MKDRVGLKSPLRGDCEAPPKVALGMRAGAGAESSAGLGPKVPLGMRLGLGPKVPLGMRLGLGPKVPLGMLRLSDSWVFKGMRLGLSDSWVLKGMRLSDSRVLKGGGTLPTLPLLGDTVSRQLGVFGARLYDPASRGLYVGGRLYDDPMAGPMAGPLLGDTVSRRLGVYGARLLYDDPTAGGPLPCMGYGV